MVSCLLYDYKQESRFLKRLPYAARLMNPVIRFTVALVRLFEFREARLYL